MRNPVERFVCVVEIYTVLLLNIFLSKLDVNECFSRQDEYLGL